jgi:hypothetical protein
MLVGFLHSMLGLLRLRATVRAAVLAAALLSVTGSTGLHTHNDVPLGRHGSPAAAGTCRDGQATSSSEKHFCLVCALHASTSLTVPWVVSSIGTPAPAPAPHTLPAPELEVARGPHSGRAPPAIA